MEEGPSADLGEAALGGHPPPLRLRRLGPQRADRRLRHPEALPRRSVARLCDTEPLLQRLGLRGQPQALLLELGAVTLLRLPPVAVRCAIPGEKGELCVAVLLPERGVLRFALGQSGLKLADTSVDRLDGGGGDLCGRSALLGPAVVGCVERCCMCSKTRDCGLEREGRGGGLYWVR